MIIFLLIFKFCVSDVQLMLKSTISYFIPYELCLEGFYYKEINNIIGEYICEDVHCTPPCVLGRNLTLKEEVTAQIFFDSEIEGTLKIIKQGDHLDVEEISEILMTNEKECEDNNFASLNRINYNILPYKECFYLEETSQMYETSIFSNDSFIVVYPTSDCSGDYSSLQKTLDCSDVDSVYVIPNSELPKSPKGITFEMYNYFYLNSYRMDEVSCIMIKIHSNAIYFYNCLNTETFTCFTRITDCTSGGYVLKYDYISKTRNMGLFLEVVGGEPHSLKKNDIALVRYDNKELKHIIGVEYYPQTFQLINNICKKHPLYDSPHQLFCGNDGLLYKRIFGLNDSNCQKEFKTEKVVSMYGNEIFICDEHKFKIFSGKWMFWVDLGIIFGILSFFIVTVSLISFFVICICYIKKGLKKKGESNINKKREYITIQ